MNRPILSYATVLVCAISILFVLPATAQKNRKRDQINYQRQKNQHQAEYFFTEGMKYYVLEDYPKAINSFQKTLEIDPDNGGANYAMADALAKSEQYRQAIPYAEKALRLDDENKYYYALLADLYERDKQLPQAIKVYNDLIKKQPDDADNYFRLAAILRRQEKFDDALKVYNQMESVVGVTEEIVRQKEQILLKLNRTEEAINEIKKLSETYPDETSYAVLLSEMYVTNGRTKEAIPLLEKIITTTPTNAQARLVLAEIYWNAGKRREANVELESAFGNPELDADVKVRVLNNYIRSLKDSTYRKNAYTLADLIIKTHPHEAEGYVIYGDLLSQSDQREKARNLYVKASEIDNSVFEVWYHIINLDAKLNQMDSLVVHTEEALELFPNQAIIWYYNGLAYQGKKESEKAVEALEMGKKLAASNKELSAQIHAVLGDAYYATGDYTNSDASYDVALASDPNNISVLNNYSYYLSLRKEKLDMARKMASQLVEKYPDNPTYLDTYAWVLYALKEYKQAANYLEKASVNTENGTILEHYGDVLYQLGETEKAMEMWMRAKNAGEASEMIDKKIAQKKLYE